MLSFYETYSVAVGMGVPLRTKSVGICWKERLYEFQNAGLMGGRRNGTTTRDVYIGPDPNCGCEITVVVERKWGNEDDWFMTPTIELLYFEGCPHYREAGRILREIIAEEKLPLTVTMIQIESQEDAVQKRFLGSPSIRINGDDVAPGKGERYGLQCRVYLVNGRLTGMPARSTIRASLRNLKVTPR